jgi:hypothetical protein
LVVLELVTFIVLVEMVVCRSKGLVCRGGTWVDEAAVEERPDEVGG